MKEHDLIVYTDGGCIGNPGPGGWAAVLVRHDGVEERGGAVAHTTNNRMEMWAAVEGLERAREGDRVHVVTDSKYLHDGVSKWRHGWKRRGWKKADGKEVLNRDIWETLDRLISRPGIEVTWEHVRGHAGHVMNERCDEIANGFARGTPPELRVGDGSWIEGPSEPPQSGSLEGLPPVARYPAYLSEVDGHVSAHRDWPSCQARIRGAKGSRCKKVRTPAEAEATVRGWKRVGEV